LSNGEIVEMPLRDLTQKIKEQLKQPAPATTGQTPP
jgi:hypothetical protein